MLISIIIPTYNSKKNVSKLVEFLSTKIYGEQFEIIVIDDGSTDGTFDALKLKYNCRQRFTLLQKVNGGAGSARNLGIKNAKGEYLWFIDADDSINKLSLTELQNVLTNYRYPDLVTFSGTVEKALNGKYHTPNQIRDPNFSCKVMSGYEYLHLILKVNNLIVQPGHFIIRREMCSPFPVGMIYEDNVFFIQNLLNASSVLQINNQFYIRKIQSGSIMNATGLEQRSKSMIQVIELIASIRFPINKKGRYIRSKTLKMFIADFQYLNILQKIKISSRLILMFTYMRRFGSVISLKMIILSIIPIFIYEVIKKIEK
ncbi:glycosyltransferase [Ascidiaceihabitans sp.]|nr:glycosyltransferase [Ascidiaceihabitans sp.]